MNRVKGALYGGILLVILAFALMELVETIWPALVVVGVLYGIYAFMFKRPL